MRHYTFVLILFFVFGIRFYCCAEEVLNIEPGLSVASSTHKYTIHYSAPQIQFDTIQFLSNTFLQIRVDSSSSSGKQKEIERYVFMGDPALTVLGKDYQPIRPQTKEVEEKNVFCEIEYDDNKVVLKSQSELLDIKVYSTNGILLREFVADKQCDIDLSTLGNGVYIVVVKSNGLIVATKTVIVSH